MTVERDGRGDEIRNLSDGNHETDYEMVDYNLVSQSTISSFLSHDLPPSSSLSYPKYLRT